MTTVTHDFEAAGVGAAFTLAPGQSLTYAAAGTFTGFVEFQRSVTQGASWERIARGAADTGIDGTVVNESNRDQRFRFAAFDTDAETPVTGTIETSIADVVNTVREFLHPITNAVLLRLTDEGVEVPGKLTPGVLATPAGNALDAPSITGMPTTTVGVGAKNGATVTAVERGDGVVHQTVLTLASTPVTVANTTGASFGGVKLYDFPAGRIAALGVTANLSLNWAGTDIAAAGSGDFALGSTITDDATLDGTDVDLLPSTGLLDPFVLGVGTGKGALAAGAQFDGTTDAVDANLNIIIDDADVADAATDIVLVSGTVTITWVNLGDY